MVRNGLRSTRRLPAGLNPDIRRSDRNAASIRVSSIDRPPTVAAIIRAVVVMVPVMMVLMAPPAVAPAPVVTMMAAVMAAMMAAVMTPVAMSAIRLDRCR